MPNHQNRHVPIESESDIVSVRKQVREFATEHGFGLTDVTRIVTAASELARNVFHYAGSGHMTLQTLSPNGNSGLELVFSDQGPGIADVDQAMEMGYSTRGGLGLGLPGVKRLMNEMELTTEINKGTTIKVRKWL